jgi:ABC-type branched-subunit amino acid transport system ATPase component
MGREPAFTRRLSDAILRHQIVVRRHVSIVIVEHNLDLVLASADRSRVRTRARRCVPSRAGAAAADES